MLLTVTMHNISDTPRKICGRTSSQKSQSLVSPVTIHVPKAKPAKPMASITRGSSMRISRPAIGAVKNMQRPVTNMVSPICSAE